MNFKLTLFTALIVVSSPLLASANPTEARLQVTFRKTNNSSTPVRVAITHNFVGEAVETDGSCVVELSACISDFIPRGEAPNNDTRSCEPVAVGTALLLEGQSVARFRSFTFPATGRRVHSQLSFQTESTCTDASDQVTEILSRPRAKKITPENGVGKVRRKVMNALRDQMIVSTN